MNDLRHEQINKAKWDRWSGVADGKGWIYEYLRKAQKNLIELLELKENINFLDIGCGTGWAVAQVAERIGGRGIFYGVDISAGMIEKAKEKYNDFENFHFLQASSESIPLSDNFFDLIICTNSFHHYLHPAKAMGEISRLLKNGGRIYILDPTADSLAIKFADKIIRLLEREHVKLYSSLEFKNLISNAGLRYDGSKNIQGKEKVHTGIKE